jgi:hypothetical protein
MHTAKIKSKSGEASPLQKLSDYYSSPIVLEKGDELSGNLAWAFLLASVIAYDAYAIKTQKAETLTRAFWRNTEKPLKSLVPIIIWTGLTVHLLLEKDIRKKKFNKTSR